MPDAREEATRCTATTPSLGVRLWITRDAALTQDAIGLQVANEGGRGNALMCVLVPVRHSASGRIEPAMDLDDFLAPDADKKDGARDLQWRSPPSTLPTPAPLRWYGDQWRKITASTPLVLVLMVYQNLRIAQTDTKLVPDGVAAIKAFFRMLRDRPAPQHAAWIRRGLVQLAAADIPDSVNPNSQTPAQSARMPAPVPASASAPAAAAFSFVLASCQYPAGLVDGTPQRFGGDSSPAGPADASMLRLAKRLGDKRGGDSQRPSLLVLTGDQIYADATAGLFDPRAGATPQARSSIRQAEDWLRIPYQNWLGSAGAQAVLGRLPVRMLLDDHEIDDNWEPPPLPARTGEDLRLDRLMQAGSQAYQRYQRDLPKAQLLSHLWGKYTHRGIRFFLADTRTERQPRVARLVPLRPCIMGAVQTLELQDWITREPERPAFIVSPSMLLPRRRRSADSARAALHSDAWDGYPDSLHRLLVHIWKTGRSNLVFLSGDEHLSSVVRATVTQCGPNDRAVSLHSVHSSALYAPYPFANAVPALFALPDDWRFNDPDHPGDCYRCVVEACTPWAPGDGFALLRLAPPEHQAPPGIWQLHICFDRAATDACHPPPPPLTLTLPSGPGPLQPPPA